MGRLRVKGLKVKTTDAAMELAIPAPAKSTVESLMLKDCQAHPLITHWIKRYIAGSMACTIGSYRSSHDGSYSHGHLQTCHQVTVS